MTYIMPNRITAWWPSGWILGAAVLISLNGGCAQWSASERTIVRANDLYVQGALAYQEGNRDRAMAALQSALQSNPDLIMARYLMGTIHRDKGEYAAAAEQYKRVTELDPYVYSNHYHLALMYHLLNRLQDASISYLAAIKLNPEDFKSNMNLGLVYTGLGRADLGLAYAQKAVDAEPRSAEAAGNLGVVLDTMGDYPAAELAYRRALELDGSRVETMINMAGCLVSQKRYKEAVSVYDQVVKSADSTLIRQRYGYALLQAGRPDDAAAQFNMAMKLNPRNYQAINGLGDVMLAKYRQSSLLDEQKRTEAVQYWQRSLQLNPDQARVTALVKEYAKGGLFP